MEFTPLANKILDNLLLYTCCLYTCCLQALPAPAPLAENVGVILGEVPEGSGTHAGHLLDIGAEGSHRAGFVVAEEFQHAVDVPGRPAGSFHALAGLFLGYIHVLDGP